VAVMGISRGGRNELVVQVRVSAVSQKPPLTGRQAGRADPPLLDRTATPAFRIARFACSQGLKIYRGDMEHAPQPTLSGKASKRTSNGSGL
jgi:hypothetical protein